MFDLSLGAIRNANFGDKIPLPSNFLYFCEPAVLFCTVESKFDNGYLGITKEQMPCNSTAIRQSGIKTIVSGISIWEAVEFYGYGPAIPQCGDKRQQRATPLTNDNKASMHLLSGSV